MFRPMTCLALCLSLCLPAVALAQTTPLPVPPVLGDGVTASTLQVLAPPGTRLRASASAGEIQSVQAIDGGHLISYAPPAVTSPTEVTLSLRVRGGGVRDDIELPVRVVPSWNGTFSVTLDTDAVGSGQSATVKVRPSTTGPTDAPRRLRANVSSGSIGDLVPSTDGSWAARYTPPPRLSEPGYAVFAIADDAAPSSFVGAGSLPITASRSLTFDAPADHTAVLQVGGREYGPTRVSPAGKVAFEVDLHPGQRQGTLTITGGANPSSKTVDLPFDPQGGLAIAPLPDKAGGGTVLNVPIACRTASGTLCTVSDLSFDVTDGTVGTTTARDDLLIVQWTLPDSGSPTFTARLGDQNATARIATLPSPISLTLTANPNPVPADQSDVEITARAKDPAGRSATGRMPTFNVRNARLIRRPSDARDGTYTGTWRFDRDAQWVEAVATTRLSPTGLAPQRLLAWPTVDRITADGSSVITLFVVAEDAAGMPVPNIDLELSVPTGDAVVAPSSRTDAHGVARVDLKIGREPGLVVVQASGGGLRAVARLWQATAEFPGPDLPPLGSSVDVDALERWKDRVAVLYVGRSTAAVATAAPATTPTAAPTPTASTPATATPSASTPGASASAGADAASKPKPSRGTADYAIARVRAALSNAPFAYQSTLIDAEDPNFAPEASFGTSPVFGYTALHLDAEVWPDIDRKIGIDTRFRAGVYRMELGANKATVAPIEFELGARYRAWSSGPWSAYAGLGFARTQGLVIAYTDETRSSAEPVNFGIAGARVGGGMRYEAGPTLVELDAQTLWTPGPSIVRAELRADIPVIDMLALTFALGGDARFNRYRVPDSDLRIGTQKLGLDMRAGVAVPFL